MKKIILTALALTLALSLAACGKNETGTPTTDAPTDAVTADETEAGDTGLAGIANPMVEYASLDEINEKAGTAIALPEGTAVEDEQFFVISENLAEYRFTLDGIEYTVRGAAEDGTDISGLYTENGTAFENDPTLPNSYTGDGVCAYTFNRDFFRYVVIAQTDDADAFFTLVGNGTAFVK